METPHEAHSKNRPLLPATLAALGIVYGDIGTSPLYAVRQCFSGEERLAINDANVFGIMSLILWSLILVVSVKYLIVVMRADNDGEGGILALMALVRADAPASTRGVSPIVLLGLFGAGLLYGDGMITPAISVLSAIEGVHVATSTLDRFVLPITLAVLFGLFFFQKHGTAKVARLFGPIMLLWFAVIAILGVYGIIQHPQILAATSPHHGVRFFFVNGWSGLAILGVVFLVVTGGEALYADMGHFGIRPIRAAWFSLVLPALLINYFGQGALLLSNPEAIRNPFYLLAPEWALYPMVLLSTVATVIASQAVISGSFSLTSQAVQLGYLPRVGIKYTSVEERGQVYVPIVNWTLFAVVVGLVLSFRSSDKLAGAYGMAVTTTMVITSILFYSFARQHWQWSIGKATALVAMFLIIDVAFFVANLPKIPDGGWFPLLIGGTICGIMTTWIRGRQIVAEDIAEKHLTTEQLLCEIAETTPIRIRTPAVYLTSQPDSIPPALIHNLRRNKVLQDPVLLLTVVTTERPWVKLDDRVSVESIGNGIHRIIARYGYMQTPSVPNVLHQIHTLDSDFTGPETTFFLGRTELDITDRPVMSHLRKVFFKLMLQTADDPSSHFRIPPEQVVEIGMRLPL